MDNYDTLFDSDRAEHDYIMSQPIKSPKTCAECAYSMAECDDVECDFENATGEGFGANWGIRKERP